MCYDNVDLSYNIRDSENYFIKIRKDKFAQM